ncbi:MULTISPECIES: large exoprotein [Microbacterium]|uniref:large exoprotein n=1 Tax=Microbacterium TaxID=33882 RepID=UPI0010F72CEE|nr:large exoprotein [Microbacterium sp. 4NA327F11]MCK9920161.1 large exoprotein [Microbacteriaceae bacterium K1510]
MDGQWLGGGVIVLVAAALWLLYFVPSWHSTHRYNAAERNAVRLGQALRILAETSDTPDEVRIELGARASHAQQRLARKTIAEQQELEAVRARRELDETRALVKAEREDAAERARADRLAARMRPAARRRRARVVASTFVLAALALAGVGVWQLLTAGTQIYLWAAAGVFAVSLLVLQRIAMLATRSRRVEAAPVVSTPVVRERVPVPVADAAASATWEPRTLPKPLTASAGSQAAAVVAAEEARAALRRAAVDEAKRQRAAQAAPPSIDVARVARVEAPAPSQYAGMGYVDDAEIEAHVRSLLDARRAG